MKVFGHPLFFVFAFTVLVCLAGIWWLLSGRRERADHERSTRPLWERDQSAMDVLESIGLDTKEPSGQIVGRAETMSRLALLDDLIAKQKSCMASARTMRLDVTLLEEQLKVLTETREEYYSALKG